MKFGSLFTGVGGFDLAFERAGFECAWQVERDAHCIEVLAEHYPNVERFTDVRTVGKHNLKPVDLICGGFPCQDLSVAGKRAGFSGQRSSLWFEFERIIDEMRPKWVVIENVPGLLSSKSGADFGFILKALDERGYGVAWRVLDSQNFGVAQRRRRVFIVASLGNIRSAEVLFESESVSGNYQASGETGEATARTLTVRSGTHGSGGRGYLSLDERAMTLGGQPQWVEPVAFDIHQNDDHRKDRPNGGLYINETDKSLTLQTGQAKSKTIIMSSGQANAEIAIDRSPTLSLLHEAPIVNGVRRLTPTECERLQGFPDGWTAKQSDTQRYKQMGNAVTVNTVNWIAKRIFNQSNNQKEE